MDYIKKKKKKGESEFGLANTNKFLNQYTGATGLKTRLFDNGINGVLGMLLHQMDGVVQLELVEPIVQIATRLLTEEAH